MGQVARAIGITTVYYSEVENGKKLPFPPHTIDYGALSEAVGGDREELEALATEGRASMGVSIKTTNKRAQGVAVTLARRMHENSLDDEQLDAIERIINEKLGK